MTTGGQEGAELGANQAAGAADKDSQPWTIRVLRVGSEVTERYRMTYEKSPPTLQPLVQVHPETGRKMLYISELTTTHIEGLNPAESDALLQMLVDHLNWKELQCRFYWRPNSIAMWDNRCTCHYAVRDYDELREMHRVTVLGKVLN